jgi:2-dehydro-3-deoxygalactonokinase
MDEKYLLGCDWGTSAFRLRLYDVERGEVFREIHSQDGVAATYKAWEEASKREPVDQERFFRRKLGEYATELSGKAGISIEGITILISGMASSSIGMRMLPYATIPFSLDGKDAVMEKIPGDKDLQNDVILVSGVRSPNDVMRGEETQLLGLMALLEKTNDRPERAVILFPGTHSKHVHIAERAMVSFETFMTGEIFSLLGKHSILRDSVSITSLPTMSASDNAAFRKGIRDSIKRNFLNAIFSVRTNQLFNELDKRENASYLSGLLIGSELQSLQKQDDTRIFLCSSNDLHEYYLNGLDEMGLLQRSTLLSGEMTDLATIAGQLILRSKAKEQR